MIDSVKIIHAEYQIKEYRFWADFFRLIGMHVWDCTLKNEDFSEDFDIVIVFERDLSEQKRKKICERYSHAVMMKNVEDESFNINGKKKKDIEEWLSFWNQYLKDGLECIKRSFEDQNVEGFQEVDFKSIEHIGTLYVSYCISYFRNVYSYFKEDEKWVQEAQNEFVDAYVELIQDNHYEKTAYTFYTLANLARYINETCVCLNQNLLVPTEQCLEYLKQALVLHSDFYNAELLKAILCGSDKAFVLEGDKYYKIAFEHMQNRKYTSYPYYLYGRYWERTRKNIEKAKKYYELSFQINELEYRAIYKLAIIAKREKRYEDSLTWFKQICSILSGKEEKNYLQPKEYEYLFKAYFEISKLYGDMFADLDRYEETMNQLNRLCEKMLDREGNRAYRELFGKQEQIFRKATYFRIRTMQVQCK